MATQWTSDQSIPSQGSTTGFGHDIERNNPTSRRNEVVEASWQPPVPQVSAFGTPGPWSVHPDFSDPPSHFPGKLSILGSSSSHTMHRAEPEVAPVQNPNIHGPCEPVAFHPFSLQHAVGPMTARRSGLVTVSPIQGVPRFIYLHPRGVRL